MPAWKFHMAFSIIKVVHQPRISLCLVRTICISKFEEPRAIKAAISIHKVIVSLCVVDSSIFNSDDVIIGIGGAIRVVGVTYPNASIKVTIALVDVVDLGFPHSNASATIVFIVTDITVRRELPCSIKGISTLKATRRAIGVRCGISIISCLIHTRPRTIGWSVTISLNYSIARIRAPVVIAFNITRIIPIASNPRWHSLRLLSLDYLEVRTTLKATVSFS